MNRREGFALDGEIHREGHPKDRVGGHGLDDDGPG